MFVTRITVNDLQGEELFNAVLLELPDLCDTFVCYPSKKMFICTSEKNAGHDYRDQLSLRGIKADPERIETAILA